jgi:hypothetical protein
VDQLGAISALARPPWRSRGAGNSTVTIEALKDELIEAKRLAIDERGRVLVWGGDTRLAESPTTRTAPSAPPSAIMIGEGIAEFTQEGR